MEKLYTIQLSFLTDTGKEAQISVTNANHLTSPAELGAAMQNIIDSQVIETDAGNLIAKNGAELIYTEIEDYSVA